MDTISSSPNNLYILVAASAVGKSELMRQMQKENLWEGVPKYSTRDVRYKDGEIDDVVEIDSIQIKDLEPDKQRAVRGERIKELKARCGEGKGVVYFKNGNLYGVIYKEILEVLKRNNAVLILSDFRAITQIKNYQELANITKVLYIASSIDERVLLERYKRRETTEFNLTPEKEMETLKNIGEFNSVVASATRLHYIKKIEEIMPLLNEEWNSILPYFETIKTRSANIRMLYNQYIENISLIDYPILNFYDLEYMFCQMRNLLEKADCTTTSRGRIKNCAPVFMVCAAPSAGKATLMEVIGDLGEVDGNIIITRKYARRSARPNTDGRDGMIAIGYDGRFEDYIDENSIWTWQFHNTENSSGIWYAVNRSEIDENIKMGKAQIFVSNMDQIQVARELYPDNLVVLYLHATHETETKNHIREKILNDMENDIVLKERCSPEVAKRKCNVDKSIIDEVYRRLDEKVEEIKKVHYSYLSHNYQIDHVLLNTGTKEDLVEQMRNLIAYYCPNGQ